MKGAIDPNALGKDIVRVLRVHQIDAVMLFPSNKERQHNLERFCSISTMLRMSSSNRVTLTKPQWENLTNQAMCIGDLSQLLVKDALRAYWQGWITGMTLNAILEGESMTAFRERLLDSDSRLGRGLRRLRLQQSTLRDSWATFRPVAHLWAAFAALNEPVPSSGAVLRGRKVFRIGETPIACAPEDLEAFVKTMAGIYDRAISTSLSHSREKALVEGECWRYPHDLKPLRLIFQEA